MGICVSTGVCTSTTTTTVVARRSNPPPHPDPSTSSSSSSSRGHRLRGSVPPFVVAAFGPHNTAATQNSATTLGGDVTPVAASVTMFAASAYSRAGSSTSLHQQATGAHSNDFPEGAFVYPSLISGANAGDHPHCRGSSFGGSRTTTTGTIHASLPAEQAADVGFSRASPYDLTANQNGGGVAALPSFFERRNSHLLQAHPPPQPPAASVLLSRRSAEVSMTTSNLNESAEHNHGPYTNNFKFDNGITGPAAAAPMAVAHPLAFPKLSLVIGSTMPLMTAKFSPAANNNNKAGGDFVPNPFTTTPQQLGGSYQQHRRSPGSALSTRTATLDAVPEAQFLLASVATFDGVTGGGLVSLLPSAELAVRSHSQDDTDDDDYAGGDDTETADATTNTITHPDPPLLPHNAASEMFGNHSATTSSMWASQFRSIDIGSTMALVQRSSFSYEA
ncbi:Hypothetical protein, putative [Bodo saltans]|uniref:Uncharacterized protein n=1 Tax=Bodo saltans TaxID=75058 RepID=A0A0S4KL25_BODSA|nr:Hypothetical protein, putative [Bodo saltans]|eukprot:CUI15307.1 Hypothetical protein, putative [Bodo saltans]